MVQFFLFFIAIPILFLLVQLLEKFDLCIKLVYNSLFLFDLIFKTVYLFTIEVLKFVPKLVNFLPQNAVYLNLILQLFLGQLVSRIRIFWLFLFWTQLHFFQSCIKLLVQLLELDPQSVILTFLSLNKLKPHLMTQYISAMRFWYFFIIRRTPSFDYNSDSDTTISFLIDSQLTSISLS